MRAGRLTDVLLLQEPVKTKGPTGESVVWWETRNNLFTEQVPLGIDERVAAMRMVEGTVTRFKVRYVPNARVTWRALYYEKAYPLVAVVDKDLRHRETHLVARADAAHYPHFTYSVISVADGEEALSYLFTWRTDGYSTSRVRYREVGAPSWTTGAHVLARVLSHSVEVGGFSEGKTYEVQVYGENAEGWSPGWSGSKQWETPAPSFLISGVSFTVGRSFITSIFTTSEAAGCRVYGCVYDPLEPPGMQVAWYNSETPTHGTGHSHQKAGLTEGTTYAVSIRARNESGDYAYAPSMFGYYLVNTASDGDPGGEIGVVA